MRQYFGLCPGISCYHCRFLFYFYNISKLTWVGMAWLVKRLTRHWIPWFYSQKGQRCRRSTDMTYYNSDVAGGVPQSEWLGWGLNISVIDCQFTVVERVFFFSWDWLLAHTFSCLIIQVALLPGVKLLKLQCFMQLSRLTKAGALLACICVCGTVLNLSVETFLPL